MNSNTETFLPSASMKMADLMNTGADLLGILPRVGIPFGFGDETVAETCRRHGVNTDTFLLICSVYMNEGYIPPSDRLEKTDLRDIVRYLHRSHAYYMDVDVQRLAADLEDMIRPCGEKHRRIIRKFFSDYKEELSKHFEYEEKVVFPYVEAVLSHTGPTGFTIDEYEKNHSNVEEKLEDLKNLVMKYMPPECDQQSLYRALSSIFTFEKDLEKHTVIEDDILVPVVNRLEKDE